MDRISVLFVCLGNICRSPAAEAIFKSLINDKGISNQTFKNISDFLIFESSITE